MKEWADIVEGEPVDPLQLPPDATALLTSCLPEGTAQVEFRTRQTGLGSLGRFRDVAVGQWRGGRVAREAKAAVPSAARTPHVDLDDPNADHRRLLSAAARVFDPHASAYPRWTLRRLSPEARKIRLKDIQRAKHRRRLLRTMGRELATAHLGSTDPEPLAAWLAGQDDRWLSRTVRIHQERLERDFLAAMRAWSSKGGLKRESRGAMPSVTVHFSRPSWRIARRILQ